MEVLPAIDLIGGQPVRLTKGSYRKMTTYAEMDPVKRGESFRDAGAAWVHVIDLDGARTGMPANLEVAAAVKQATGLKMEFGGGVRTLPVLESVLAAGADRVIIGTAAFSSPEFLAAAVARCGPALAVSVDIRGGEVLAKGWRESTRMSVDQAMGGLVAAGVKTVIFTDTDRDGTLEGVAVDRVAAWMSGYEGKGMSFLAAGGVHTLEDIRNLGPLALFGLVGVVAGKALYEGTLDLKTALALARTT